MTSAPTAGTAHHARRRPGWVLPVVLALPSVLLAVLVALAWPPLLALDRAVTGWAVGLAVQHPVVGRAGRAVEVATEPGVWWVLASVAALVAMRHGARRSVRVTAGVIVIAGIASPLLKLVVGRLRPALEGAVTGVDGGSYPSGHVLAATVVGGCGCLVGSRLLRRAWQRRLLWLLWGFTVLVVALDRLVVGAHWLSDTLGSISLGSALLVAAARRLRPPRRGTPPAADGGSAVRRR